MTARQRYARAMEWTYFACIALSGAALVAITLMIPAGVFMRYVMNNPMSWPEPAAVVLMVMFSFIGGAAVYRANVHVAVEALVNAVSPAARRAMRRAVDACMGVTALFMIGYGIHLCVITRFQSMAEFPWLSVAFVYLPIPIGGFLTLLFLIERVWAGSPPATSIMYRDQVSELE
ncbi:MAG: TRAP transporter small permease [Pseudomonadota bacterium]|nr:TRAP transporter small permease [Burkholderiaceae bacterium]MDQ3445418.1 TRAP transporter small permease [Pseudomonadota bacterium]